MWALRSASAKPSMGEAMETQMVAMPRLKQTRRQVGKSAGLVLRMAYQPRV